MGIRTKVTTCMGVTCEFRNKDLLKCRYKNKYFFQILTNAIYVNMVHVRPKLGQDYLLNKLGHLKEKLLNQKAILYVI